MQAIETAHCPTCGAGLTRRRVEGRDQHYCEDCDRAVTVGGPRPSAGVVVIDRGRTLLVERTEDSDVWTVPGDPIERGEAPTAAATRGLREATGLSADPGDLALVDARPAESDTLSICYAVGLPTTRGYVTESAGAAAVRFFSVEELRSDEYDFAPHAPTHAGAALRRLREV